MSEPDRMRGILPVHDRAERVTTEHDAARQQAEFTPHRTVSPPRGAPNVVIAMIDDMGFGASSPFGGPCEMPTAQRLSDGGLRYTRFHVTALCSPTRQALLTGRNHHSVGMGGTSEMATSAPGYDGFRPRSAATIAQILQGNGYRTAAFGKWHQTPPSEVSPVGPFDRWPTGEGFDKFYGFMGAEMNHWYPLLYDGTTPVEPTRTPEQGYHLTEDLIDQAIDWLNTGNTLAPDRPFFTYLSFGATHAPLHVAPEWQDRYAGKFAHGWDRQREITLARQHELGVVPRDAGLAPWIEEVPHWADLSDTQRTLAERFMETYAGFAEHTDHQFGRFVDALEQIGQLDNTVIFYILGDNGATGEGGIEGSLVEHRLGHGIVDDPEEMLTHIAELGGSRSYAIAPVGWSLAMNTPYQWTKQIASHFGGTRDGMILHWPDRVPDPGAVRHQFHHVIDVLPTILAATGIPAPEQVEGVTQQPIEGTSLCYTVDDADAEDRHTTQYFEMCGNRGIYHHGWIAVTRHGIPWEMVSDNSRGFDDDKWELYDLSTDWSQANDISAQHPRKLAELQQLFLIEAAKHQVFPLDDRVTERENPVLAGRVDLLGDRTSVTYRGGMRRFTEETAPNVKNRSHTITAVFDAGEKPANGVLVSQGGRFGGWTLYCVDGELRYSYNYFGMEHYRTDSAAPLTAGHHRAELRFHYAGGGLGKGGTTELLVDDQVVAQGKVDRTVPFYFSFDETLDVGVDLGTPTSEDYAALENEFTGTIDTVTITLDTDGPTEFDEAGKEARIMASQ